MLCIYLRIGSASSFRILSICNWENKPLLSASLYIHLYTVYIYIHIYILYTYLLVNADYVSNVSLFTLIWCFLSTQFLPNIGHILRWPAWDETKVGPKKSCHFNSENDWSVVYLPLWKIWLRQLGWWNSQLNGKINKIQTGENYDKHW